MTKSLQNRHLLLLKQNKYVNLLIFLSPDEVAEWLRRWTANPMCSARVGSNPILVDRFFFFFFCSFLSNYFFYIRQLYFIFLSGLHGILNIFAGGISITASITSAWIRDSLGGVLLQRTNQETKYFCGEIQSLFFLRSVERNARETKMTTQADKVRGWFVFGHCKI